MNRVNIAHPSAVLTTVLIEVTALRASRLGKLLGFASRAEVTAPATLRSFDGSSPDLRRPPSSSSEAHPPPPPECDAQRPALQPRRLATANAGRHPPLRLPLIVSRRKKKGRVMGQSKVRAVRNAVGDLFLTRVTKGHRLLDFDGGEGFARSGGGGKALSRFFR